eukprot:3381735-Prymnesium_polylepis.1
MGHPLWAVHAAPSFALRTRRSTLSALSSPTQTLTVSAPVATPASWFGARASSGPSSGPSTATTARASRCPTATSRARARPTPPRSRSMRCGLRMRAASSCPTRCLRATSVATSRWRATLSRASHDVTRTLSAPQTPLPDSARASAIFTRLTSPHTQVSERVRRAGRARAPSGKSGEPTARVGRSPRSARTGDVPTRTTDVSRSAPGPPPSAAPRSPSAPRRGPRPRATA